MNIHEHQAKELLGKHGVPVQSGRVAYTPEQAVEAAHYMIQEGATLLILKAQIHAGGRGKGTIHDPNNNQPIELDGKGLRGVKVIPVGEGDTLDTVYKVASGMIGNKLVTLQTGAEGKVINRLLVANGVDIEKEFYCAILLDRATGKNIIMASTEGGMEIEHVAEHTPEKIFRVHVEPGMELAGFQARTLAFGLGLTGAAQKSFLKFIPKLYNAYLKLDASMLEINPLVLTPAGEILAVDAKVSIDDSALYRHPDVAAMRDTTEEDPLEVEAGKHDLNYIKLDGNVGCMVNGAGLAMATMDIIKLAGGDPANFLDVGGGASVDRVAAAFRVMMSDPNVKVVLINIFGGIVRCDRVANGIIQAMQTVNVNIPVIVRLDGTNAEEAREILMNSSLDFSVAATLQDAAEKVSEAIAGLGSNAPLEAAGAGVANLAMSSSASVTRPLGEDDDDDDEEDLDEEDDDTDEDDDLVLEPEEEIDSIEDIDIDFEEDLDEDLDDDEEIL
jgi:succinyl-CoA synthetase beta subunit